MPTYRLQFCEIKTREYWIDVDINAPSPEEAAEKAMAAYERGELDMRLEETEPDTTECRTAVYRDDGATLHVLLPPD